MAAVKTKRHSPSMDMTAMTDVAFLLLTFFIMASSFKSEEAVKVETPSSVSEELIPEKNIGMVTIDRTGKYYFGMIDPTERDDYAKAISDEFNLGLTNDEIVKFTKLAEVGVPMKSLKGYLNLADNARAGVQLTGIPLDSTDNELVKWVQTYAKLRPEGKIAVKGDATTQYPAIKNLFDEFGKAKLNKFQLITKAEKK